MYTAKRRGGIALILSYIVLVGLAVWAVRHIERLVEARTGSSPIFTLVYATSFFMLAWQSVLYMLEKPYTTIMAQDALLARRRIVANVPVCNEDAEALEQCLVSMLNQSRKIDVIHVVVNGPNKVDYTQVKAWALKKGILWDWQEIAGKRQAQATTVRKYLKANDIFLTVDSDAYLDKLAVEEGIKPLADRRVMSVAGIVLTMNNRKKLLTRLSDLWFLTGQLVDRSAYSTMGSVLVNSGVLAFYRAHIVIDNLDSYTNETFFGRAVEFSDDSMLTIYALQQGRCVQQPTSFAFTLMPETFNHHIRQQLRWCRGAFIRSWWRFKYLPLNTYAFWGHLIGWVQLISSTALFVYLFVVVPVIQPQIIPYLLIVPLAIGYAQGLRYLTVWRSDESFGYRFKTFLMQPIATLYSFFVLRFVRWYAIFTCLKTGWGTRADVEVKN